MNKELKWYAVYTRPKWEKKVANLLEENGIEQYCPLNKIVRQWSDRKKILLKPLFTSYVFVRIKETDHIRIKQINGIISLVYWLGKPAVIRDEEIDNIKQFLNCYHDVKIENAKVNVNDKVKIIQGPLQFMEGNVVKVLNNSIKVFLPGLRFTMIAQVQNAHVEKIID